MARRRQKRGSLEKFLPLGYFAVALALVVIVLPSALRPPTQQPVDDYLLNWMPQPLAAVSCTLGVSPCSVALTASST